MPAIHIAKPASRTCPAGRAVQQQVSPKRATGSTIQRHGCACGGNCPRCKATSGQPDPKSIDQRSDTHGREAKSAVHVQFMPPPLQRKPTVSSPGDPFEREADAVADKVMRMTEPSPIGAAPDAIQRKCEAGEEAKTIQAKRAPSVNAEATLDTESAIRAAEHGGAPLPGTLRSFFEPRFGHDFSRVRVHADGRHDVIGPSGVPIHPFRGTCEPVLAQDQ